jgi:integrase
MAKEPIHQLSSGRWELCYRDPHGRPRRMRFDTKGDAKDHLADTRVKGRTGSWVAPELGRVTFGKWVDEWWTTTVHLRSAIRYRYDRDLRLHIRPRFERTPIAKIMPRDVRAWLSEMQAAKIPASSIRRRFSVFRKVMGDAVAMEMIARTPCRGATPPPDTKLDITVLTSAEVAQLAAAMPKWCRSWVWTAAYTGLRWSEMIGLQRRDVDLLRKRSRSGARSSRSEALSRGSESQRRPPASGPSTSQLFCARCSKPSFPSGPSPARRASYSSTPGGIRPTLSSFTSQTWKKAREKISRPYLRWHDLRHTSVALAIANGAHPKAIQERMGHSSITITFDRYGHLFPSLGIEVADGLEASYQAALTTGHPVAGTVTEIRKGLSAWEQRLRRAAKRQGLTLQKRTPCGSCWLLGCER